MTFDEADDLQLLDDRLRLGLPLRGFDGRDIPLRYSSGLALGPIEAAILLMLSATRLHPAKHSDGCALDALARAAAIQHAARGSGDPPQTVVEKTTNVLVEAAVRASVVARRHDAGPEALHRATLSWYQLSDLRRRALLARTRLASGGQLSA